MIVFRRHPLTGKPIRQDLNVLRSAPEVAEHALSPGRAVSEDVPAGQALSLDATSYPVQTFRLVRDVDPV
jgi:hypothetical protein